MAVPSALKESRREAWPALLHRLVRTVRSRGLFLPGAQLLVAVSGGPDSVALLSLLHRLRGSWRLTLTAVHVNYGLRGEESEGDQAFVDALCRRLDVPLVVRRVDLHASARKGSLQAIARDLRYRALRDCAEQCGAGRIAVGHTADDQAETVLLWILRGAGLTGLAGMPAARDATIVRPLYDSTRADVLAYLSRAGLPYRQDSSNDRLIYARNRIRHELVPLMKRLAPKSVEALCRLADLCRDDDRFLDGHVAALSAGHIRQDAGGAWTVDREFVRQLPRPLQRRLLRDLLRRCDPLARGASARIVETARHAVLGNGTAVRSWRGVRLEVTGAEVRCWPASADPRKRDVDLTLKTLAVPFQIHWGGTGCTIEVQQLTREQVPDVRPSAGRIVLDAERVTAPLTVRHWQPGDRFYPVGLKGRSKKLQDFFTDLKVPAAARRRLPLIAAPEGIVWVVGYRQDERWMVTPRTTQCLVVTVRVSAGLRGEGAS